MPMAPRHRCADSRTPGRFVLPLLAVVLALLLPVSANALEGAAPTSLLDLAGNWKSRIGDAPGWAGAVVGRRRPCTSPAANSAGMRAPTARGVKNPRAPSGGILPQSLAAFLSPLAPFHVYG